MRRLADMLAAGPAFTYAYNSLAAEYRIIHYSRPNSDMLITDQMTRAYCGWNMTEGVVKSVVHRDSPTEMTAIDTVGGLNNLAVAHVPEVDFTVPGSGALRPGLALGLEWNLDRTDSPFDESLPAKVVTGTVSHWYSAQKYLTRVKGVLPL